MTNPPDESGATIPSPPARQRQQRAELTERKILDAAELLFAQHGFEAVTTKQLAAAGGVATGALYHHFASKDEIYRAVVERAFEGRSDVPPHLLDRTGDPAKRLTGIIAWFTGGILSDETFRLLFNRELLDPKGDQPHLLDREVFRDAFEVFRDAVSDAAPQADVDEAAAVVLALAYGLSNLRGIYEIYPGARRGLSTPDGVAEYTTRLLLGGLAGQDQT